MMMTRKSLYRSPWLGKCADAMFSEGVSGYIDRSGTVPDQVLSEQSLRVALVACNQ
jgi:hypothetical protein